MFDSILDIILTDGWYAACRFQDAIKRFDKWKKQKQQQQLILYFTCILLIFTCSVSNICWQLSSKHETHLPSDVNVHGPIFTWEFFHSDSNENSKIRRTKYENFMRFRWIVMRHILTHCKFHTEWNKNTRRHKQTNNRAKNKTSVRCTSRRKCSRMKLDSYTN